MSWIEMSQPIMVWIIGVLTSETISVWAGKQAVNYRLQNI